MTTIDRAESDSLQAIVMLRLEDTRRLVDIATDHLALDTNAPALRMLGGLDLAGPVDPYDARDFFFGSIEELGLAHLPVEHAGQFAGYAHVRLITFADAVGTRRNSTGGPTRREARLPSAASSPNTKPITSDLSQPSLTRIAKLLIP